LLKISSVSKWKSESAPSKIPNVEVLPRQIPRVYAFIYLCRRTAVDPTRTLVPTSLELQDLEPNLARYGGAITLVYLLVR